MLVRSFLVSMAHLYVFEMRSDLGTLDSVERSLPFRLLVCKTEKKVFRVAQIIIIAIITLFQEDNIFGTDASLT